MRPGETARQGRDGRYSFRGRAVQWATQERGCPAHRVSRRTTIASTFNQRLQSRRPVRTGSDWWPDASCGCSDHSLNRHRRTQHSSDRTEQRRSHSTNRDNEALSPTMSYELVAACSTDGNAERPRGLACAAATVSKFRTQQLQEQGSPGGTAPWLPRLGEIEGRLSERVSDSQLVQAD